MGRKNIFAKLSPLKMQCGSFLGLAHLLHFVLPHICVSCQRICLNESGLCPCCWGEISHLAPPWCERLGIAFSHDLGDGALSPQALAHPPEFARARAAVIYEGPARRLVHRFKFNDHPELSEFMAHMMSRAGYELLASKPLIMPVPLHFTRLWRRGYNQSALLAASLARLTGRKWLANGLTRIRRTLPQIGLARAQRNENVKGAFGLRPGFQAQITGRNILLIDDVFTTGATANSCTHALLKAGAANVDVLTFAQARPSEPLTA